MSPSEHFSITNNHYPRVFDIILHCLEGNESVGAATDSRQLWNYRVHSSLGAVAYSRARPTQTLEYILYIRGGL